MGLISETYSIGVDFGATNLRIVSYGDGIEFLDIIRVKTYLAEGRDQVIRNMCKAIHALAARKYGAAGAAERHLAQSSKPAGLGRIQAAPRATDTRNLIPTVAGHPVRGPCDADQALDVEVQQVAR